MLATLKLEYVGPATKMELAFAQRLNLLTGDNGLGKSFILDCAWWVLNGSWAGEQAWPQPEHRKRASLSWRRTHAAGESRQRPVHTSKFSTASWHWSGYPVGEEERSLVVYARVDRGYCVWDPARSNLRFQRGKLLIEDPGVHSYVFAEDTLWNGYAHDGRVLCNGLLRDWVSWQQQDASEFKTLRDLLGLLSPGEHETLTPGPPTQVDPLDDLDIPTLALPYGVIPLTHVSAGVRRILALAYLLVWAWHGHARASKLRDEPPTREIVLLIDELEAHLHPSWQRLLLPALLRVAARLRPDVRIQIIAATHAPLMLASVEPEFDPKLDALFTLDLVRANGHPPSVVVKKADWRARGDANTWLVSDVFDLKTPRSVPAEKALEKATAALRQPDLPLVEVRRIHHELHRVLRDTDPFWARWEARAKAAGIKP